MIVELLKPSKEIAEIINPKNKAPQSPIKILAGCQLYIRKPKVAPAKIKAIVWMSHLLSTTDKQAMIIKIIVDIPPARPSNPSIRLTALVIPIIQISVTSTEISPISI